MNKKLNILNMSQHDDSAVLLLSTKSAAQNGSKKICWFVSAALTPGSISQAGHEERGENQPYAWTSESAAPSGSSSL